MSSSRTEQLSSACTVTISDDRLVVELVDGRTLTVPLAWYPRLLHAAERERNTWRLIGGGEGIRWDELDEDISVSALLSGARSTESAASFAKWLASRNPTQQ
jgi:hypothetical protein